MVNGTRVTTSTGIPYNIKSPLLERIAKDAPQVPKDTFLAFGNVPSGSFDSSIFGFFDQKSLIGRVLLSKK